MQNSLEYFSLLGKVLAQPGKFKRIFLSQYDDNDDIETETPDVNQTDMLDKTIL